MIHPIPVVAFVYDTGSSNHSKLHKKLEKPVDRCPLQALSRLAHAHTLVSYVSITSSSLKLLGGFVYAPLIRFCRVVYPSISLLLVYVFAFLLQPVRYM